MRRIYRETLPKRAASYLNRKQREVDRGAEPRHKWDSARKTKTMRAIADTLARMSGKRSRCMFCGDSRGMDIEHFWPVVPYKDRTFLWDNLLWACAGCNRAKGNRFDLDAAGSPMLIDPTAEDPWDFLFFDTHTGIIKAKCNPDTGQFSAKGKYTTDSGVLPMNIEAVTEGRQRTARNLRRAVATFLDKAPTDLGIATSELLQVLRDNDDYGLIAWYFLREGSQEEPFRRLKEAYPDVWDEIGVGHRCSSAPPPCD